LLAHPRRPQGPLGQSATAGVSRGWPVAGGWWLGVGEEGGWPGGADDLGRRPSDSWLLSFALRNPASWILNPSNHQPPTTHHQPPTPNHRPPAPDRPCSLARQAQLLDLDDDVRAGLLGPLLDALVDGLDDAVLVDVEGPALGDLAPLVNDAVRLGDLLARVAQ